MLPGFEYIPENIPFIKIHQDSVGPKLSLVVTVTLMFLVQVGVEFSQCL